MIDRELYHVEIAGRMAAIYIVGMLSQEATQQLTRELESLPRNVDTLCINVPDLELLGESATSLVRELRRQWRSARGGPFRLTFLQRGANVTDTPPTRLQTWSPPLA